MSLKLYRQSDGVYGDAISEDLTNPDTEYLNGTDGDSQDEHLLLANERTKLQGAILAGDGSLVIKPDRFEVNEFVVVDSEHMQITAKGSPDGGGNVACDVTRGVNGTTAAGHSDQAVIYSAYQYQNVVAVVRDTDGTSSDESSWIKLAATSGGLASGGQTLSIGAITHTETKNVHRRVTIPASTPVQVKTDLKIRVVGTKVALVP